MFTGIVQSLGEVQEIIPIETGKKFRFADSVVAQDLKPGDSICCSGVCLSATDVSVNGFTCYAVKETLEKTNLQNLEAGSPVNFELALLPDTRLGGHFVSGHVDSTVVVKEVQTLPDHSAEVTFIIPKDYVKYCIPKGSIAFNGVSLTIARIEGNDLTVALIPVTLESTNLGALKKNDKVNMEVDATGKYIETFFKHYINEENPAFFERLVK